MKTIILILFSFGVQVYAQKNYKALMSDISVNFYEVCRVADLYFDTVDKNLKGSGWKGYQRWKNENEYKYYPSGNRDHIDPYFTENAYKTFLEGTPTPTPNNIFYANGWLELGPNFVDSITGAYSAGLGRVEDLYVDPLNGNKMYIGSRSGGFWKTTDGGLNWQGGSTDFLTASGVNTITASPTNSDSVLINVRNATNGFSHGIYRSVDGGNTWQISNFNPTNLGFGGLGSNFKINKVVYHPTVPNLIFIATSYGIYRSDDNLQTWTSPSTASGNITDIAFHPTDTDILYLSDTYYWGTNMDFVLRSTDMGLSYSLSNIVPGNNGNRSVRLSVSTDCADCLYFASTNGVWKSTDEGVNFTFLINPSQNCEGFAVNDLDTSKMVYGYVDIMNSADGGSTFNQVTWWSLGSSNHGTGSFQYRIVNSSAYIHADLRSAKCVNGVFYVGTDGFFCKSTDNGNTWEILSQGTGIRENYKLGLSQSNHYRSISGSQDNGTSIRHKNTWIEFYGADGMEGYIHPLNADWMIGSLQYGGRRRTKTAGQTQSGITPPNTGQANWEAPINYDPNNQMRTYDFRDSVFVSEDFGSSWTYRGKPSTFTNDIQEAAIAENNSDIILVSYGHRIEKSTDGGATFASILGNLPTNGTIEDIAFDPNNDEVIVVTYARYQIDNNKVFMTTNGGATWTNITYNIGNMPIRAVVIDHTDSANIYLGAEIGVYTKPMNGSTWTLYNTNLPNTTIKELEINYGSNSIKAATWGRGLWEYTLVDRDSYPSVITTRITDQPTDLLPKFSIDQFVTSTISYNNPLTSVFVKWSANNLTLGNTISMSNTQDSTWVSQTAIPNQIAGTKIYFKVFAVGNNGDTTETYKFMYTVKPFEYCTSSGSMATQGNITLVDFNTIYNATGKTQPYTDYTATHSTSLWVDSTYELSINVNTNNGNYTYYTKIWIDWNHDAIFEVSEEYELGVAQNVTNGPTSFSPLSITVPANAVLGSTRMRVATKYYWGYASPCDNNYDGEVEDYEIVINNVTSLSVNIVEPSICLNEFVHFTYTGDAIDSVLWRFTNGTDIFTSTNFNDSLQINAVGSYDLTLFGYHGGDTLTLSSTNILQVSTVDNSISQVDHVLTSNLTGATYQWLDCDQNWAPIIGETGISFTAIVNGNYALEVTNSQNCTDTSLCVIVSVPGLTLNENGSNIKTVLYPNPTSGLIKITGGVIMLQTLEIYNLLGQNIIGLVKIEVDKGIVQTIDLKELSPGIYYVKSENRIYKVQKE